ncbi:mannitol-1-phosphate 5-dehydrogenase [Paenibacillus albicereus]|uniref:Mannitol-1-phosphate 5-dehydrogenase n=1 Tax=Paenibacillus albicereus TaxID=2726185 RepID=A0A6H2GVN0_9BACL|nr:mannitol-1-phosphate 5-dehydrogenase [Paenibacillus albicereus]QJC51455.1 mannitol-1-phosphate 5-dehydrogenase [Paenibacillus albicereus]
MKAVHFGAGNIGRGFIGLLLSQAGYEVVFSDVNEPLVRELQRRGEYEVTLAEEAGRQFRVGGVSAIDGRDPQAVAEAVASADLVTTAVGVGVLRHIAPGIAAGLQLRLARGGAPLHLIACENAIGASTILKQHVMELLSGQEREALAASTAFPDSAVDRIVPIQHHEDILAVTVEPFYEWVVNRSQLLPGAAEIPGVHYVDDLAPYIERKLFTVNTGHCSAAYAGYAKGFATIQQSMQDEEVAGFVRSVLRETGDMLVRSYGFDAAEHDAYIETILGRFRNPHLTDEVARVGRSPLRKLSREDRLVRPALLALEQGLPADRLAEAMGLALRFDEPGDPEAMQLQQALRELGPAGALAQASGLGAEHPLVQAAAASYEQEAQAS